jgi:cytochrome b561
MRTERDSFSGFHRVLHWLMAIMVLTMLFIGVSMVSTLKPRFLTLISIHKPLGIAILALTVLRLGVRWGLGAPPLPDDLPRVQAVAAKLSHIVLYALLIAMPLVGWGMLSAGGYPVVLYGSLHLPEILAHDDELHAILRTTHTVLAYMFFATILLHVGAALFHALIRRDGVFRAMAGISIHRVNSRTWVTRVRSRYRTTRNSSGYAINSRGRVSTFRCRPAIDACGVATLEESPGSHQSSESDCSVP